MAEPKIPSSTSSPTNIHIDADIGTGTKSAAGILAVVLGYVAVTKLKIPGIDATVWEQVIATYRWHQAMTIARENNVPPEVASRFIDFVMRVVKDSGFRGVITPKFMRDVAAQNIRAFQLCVRAHMTRATVVTESAAGDALRGVINALSDYSRTWFNQSIKSIREIGPGTVAATTGAVTYVTTTSVGAASGAAVAGVATAGAAVGVAAGCGINALIGEPCLGDWEAALSANGRDVRYVEDIQEEIGNCEETSGGGTLCGPEEIKKSVRGSL